MANYLTDVTIVLPSLDPDERFLQVVQGLVRAGFADILIVNDGSSPDRLTWFEQAAAYPACTVLTHEGNKGKGRALKTAFSYICQNRPHSLGAVTIDGDGQHLLKDIIACAQAMLEHPNKVILGCRDFSLPRSRPKAKAATNSPPPCFCWAAASACRILRPACAPFPGTIWRDSAKSGASGSSMRPICF